MTNKTLVYSFCEKSFVTRKRDDERSYLYKFIPFRYVSFAVLVTLIGLLIENGPAVLGSVRIIESTEVVGVEDAIVTVLRDPKTWHHL